ncbi:CotH kinase family protein [Blautia glucerasea]|uniref:CotH kinase family protein n=1 Tax=Blautia glucerasea TaxID=536633 RepID=UPI001D00F175|nr:CotH kinase family protein [Blautia glucerasea]MCB5385457.1 CotH kinase family protein [Blautia glucerasea]MCB5420136.1 CotH kinase family protein [Blautia luti]
MVTNKYITKIISALMAFAVILCLVASAFSKQLQSVYGNNAVTMEYESKLFDTDQIMDIDILMDEDDWNDMLENALSEEYYSCDVVVNGKTFYSVGIRPKGNTSLSSIASDPDTDRYSFKLEFDHYIEGQTCYGLDKLILNNNYADATNMKEAIVYDMYQYLGVDASLYNYAKICVNGDYWGVYLALEAVEDSFMLRNYGTEDGNLYKPESMGVGGGEDEKDGEGGPGGEAPEMGEFPGEEMPQMGGDPQGGEMPQMGNGNMPEDFQPPENGKMPENADFSDHEMGAMGGSGGADLNYTDDDLDSYSTIWDGEVTDSGKKDHKRVVEALKNISEGTDLETYMDVDNILKYMAVHTFVVNDDSLSGTMAHNYYLYEYNGQLNILPWDYNLSFGGMSMGGGMGGQSSGATSVINDVIDTPFSITNFFDALLEDEEYLAKYHEYLNELVEKYVNGGEFQKTYERIRSQIDDLVSDDPTAFYSYEEYDAAAQMLLEVVSLRAESVSGQLDGTIPSTDDGQQEDSSSLIDGSDIDLSVMGTMSGGGGAGHGAGGPGGGPDGNQMFPGSQQNEKENEASENAGQNFTEKGNVKDSDGNEALQKAESDGVQ